MKRPYHELEAEIDHLRHKLEVMSRALIEAHRDPTEYRRGYEVGYRAGRRRADFNRDIKRRVRL